MRLIEKDFVSMDVEYKGEKEKAFLLGAFSTTIYDFEIMKEGILQVDVPVDKVKDFYTFLGEVFVNYNQYMR